MILEMTFRDNDFIDLLIFFANSFRELFPLASRSKKDLIEYRDSVIEADTILAKVIFLPAGTTLSSDDEAKFISITKDSMSVYLKNKTHLDNDTLNYLLDNFECRVLYSIDYLNEDNNEVVYLSFGNKNIINFR